MPFVRVTQAESGLGSGRDGRVIAEEWLEVAPEGRVTREIGWDVDGSVVHLFPSAKYPSGDYGLWDLATVDPTGFEQLDPELFEARWRDAQRAADLLPRLPGPTGWRAVALVVLALVFFALVIAYDTRGLWMR